MNTTTGAPHRTPCDYFDQIWGGQALLFTVRKALQISEDKGGFILYYSLTELYNSHIFKSVALLVFEFLEVRRSQAGDLFKLFAQMRRTAEV